MRHESHFPDFYFPKQELLESKRGCEIRKMELLAVHSVLDLHNIYLVLLMPNGRSDLLFPDSYVRQVRTGRHPFSY